MTDKININNYKFTIDRRSNSKNKSKKSTYAHGFNLQTDRKQNKIISCAILPQKQQQLDHQYEIHKNPQKPNSIVFFDRKSLFEREFDQICRAPKMNKLNSSRQKQQKQHSQSKDAFEDPLTIVSETIVKHPNNLFILPTINETQTNVLILGQEGKSGALQIVVEQYLKNKVEGASILLSIIGIKEQYLTDQLNFQWIERGVHTPNQSQIARNRSVNFVIPPTDPLLHAKKKQPVVKVHKDHQQIFFQQLSRHEVSSIAESKEIIEHYLRLKQQIARWQMKHEQLIYTQREKGKNKYNEQQNISEEKNQTLGHLFQISMIVLNEQSGKVQQIIRKTYFLLLKKQYPLANKTKKMYNFKSNKYELLEMKLCALFKELLSADQNYQHYNNQVLTLIRDNQVLLGLKDCFMMKKFKQNYHFTLFNQVARMPTLKDELVGLNLDLATSIKRKYFHNQRNYSDKSKLMKFVKQNAKSFIPLTNAERKMMIRQNWRGCSYQKQTSPYNPIPKFRTTKDFQMKRKQLLLIESSEKIRNKSYYCETKSSLNKRNFGHEGLNFVHSNQDTKRSPRMPSNSHQAMADVYGRGLWQSQKLEK